MSIASSYKPKGFDRKPETTESFENEFKLPKFNAVRPDFGAKDSVNMKIDKMLNGLSRQMAGAQGSALAGVVKRTSNNDFISDLQKI